MAIRGALGEQWDAQEEKEEEEECGMGGRAHGPVRAGLRDHQLEEERERGAGGRDETDRLPSPPPERKDRGPLGLPLIHSLLAPGPPGPPGPCAAE